MSIKIEEYFNIIKQIKSFGGTADFSPRKPELSFNSLFDKAVQIKKEILQIIITQMSLTNIINNGTPFFVIINQSEDDSPKKALQFMTLGKEKRNKKGYDAAIDYYFKAFEINMSYYGMTLSMGTNLNYLSEVFNDKGNYDVANAFIQKALAIDLNEPDPNYINIASDYNKMGSIYSNMENFAKAIDSHKKALEFDLKVFSDGEKSYDRTLEYIQADNWESAVKLAKPGIILKANHISNVIGDYLNLGTAYSKLGDKDTAIIYIKKARDNSMVVFGSENELTKTLQHEYDLLIKK